MSRFFNNLKIIQDQIINKNKTLDQLVAEYGCERTTISKIFCLFV